jgi:hypothetical protein
VPSAIECVSGENKRNQPILLLIDFVHWFTVFNVREKQLFQSHRVSTQGGGPDNTVPTVTLPVQGPPLRGNLRRYGSVALLVGNPGPHMNLTLHSKHPWLHQQKTTAFFLVCLLLVMYYLENNIMFVSGSLCLGRCPRFDSATLQVSRLLFRKNKTYSLLLTFLSVTVILQISLSVRLSIKYIIN